MKRTFAIPTMDGKACAHFGHCQSFAVVEVIDGQLGGVKFLRDELQTGVNLCNHGTDDHEPNCGN